MAKYFIKPDGSMSQVFTDEPLNPDEYEIKDIKKLPAPIEYCLYQNGKIVTKDGYLEGIKTAAKTAINATRDKVEQKVFAFNYRGVTKYIDSNSDAVARITVSERMGEAEHWTCADDELIYLEPKELTEMLDALRRHSKKCFETSLLWKAYLDSCSTAQEIESLMAQFNEGVFSAN